MEKVIETIENLGLTMRKLNTNENNIGKYMTIVNDILKKNNKMIFYIFDSKIIKKFMKNVHNEEYDNCMIMFNFHGDNIMKHAIFNYNNNDQIKNIEKQFMFLLQNKTNNECCICFEKKECMKCPGCINVVCLDCVNEMKGNNQILICPCCRMEWD